MSFWGKLHEISLYGLISAIICIIPEKSSFLSSLPFAIKVDNFGTFFQVFLFWASVLFVPIAIIGAIETKRKDQGEGLLFKSNHVVVIIFAHLAEDVLGIFMTPIWFVKDLRTHNLKGFWKKCDYCTYAIEIVFYLVGIIILLS